MSILTIESSENPRFKALLQLNESSRERRKRRSSVLEGERLISAYFVSEVFRAGISDVTQIFVKTGGVDALWALGAPRSLQDRVLELSEPLFKRASQLENSPGPIAVIDTPDPSLPANLVGDTVYLDRVQDPGNMGTILRTCVAAGVKQVVTAPGSAFCWAPKVLRAAMGAHFGLSIHEGINIATLLMQVPKQDVRRAMVVPDDTLAPRDLFDEDLRATGVWLFGSEGEGLSQSVRSIERIAAICIDQQAEVESMNVAAAVAVCLFEQRRQRR